MLLLAPSCADFIKPCITMGNMSYRPLADIFSNYSMPSEVELATLDLSSHRGPQAPSLKMAAHAAQTDRCDEAPVVLLRNVTSQNTHRVWPEDQRWQESESDLESESTTERSETSERSEVELHRTVTGLGPGGNATAEAVVRQLITERDKLAEEMKNQWETFNNEKSEWQQFQMDLLATVAAADRLRADSEEARVKLQDDRKSLQEQLAEAHAKQLEAERELDCLRSQQTDMWSKLPSLEKKQQKVDARLVEDKGNPVEGEEMKTMYFVEEVGMDNVQKQEECDACEEKGAKRPISQLTAKGIGKFYVDALEQKNGGGRNPRRIVMTSEKYLSRNLSCVPVPGDSCHNNNAIKTSSTLPQSMTKEEPTQGKMYHILKHQDSKSSCRTVLVETSGDLETSPTADVPSQPSRLQMDVACTKPPLVAAKRDEDPPSEVVNPPEVPHAPLQHLDCTRQTLMNQCQAHTKGYQYVEINNFSTCWEDGLAFCALYHKYLPSRIPYNSLNPAAKKENLDLAFRTGESVGITATLSVEDMLKDTGPDCRKVQRYIKSIFHHFEAEAANAQDVDPALAV
ncbi:cytospin-A-like isoform X2 [Festucalex cinctus]